MFLNVYEALATYKTQKKGKYHGVVFGLGQLHLYINKKGMNEEIN